MSTKSLCAVRSLAFEDMGFMSEALADSHYEFCYAAPWDPGTLERMRSAAIVVLLGGPISVNDARNHPFLNALIEAVRIRLHEDRPTLGICLGAQLIARALGAAVYPASGKEIGLAPIIVTAEGRGTALHAFAENVVLHWHGETFDLPFGAVRLASTSVCPNQAFSFGRNVLACQFHPEAAGATIEPWLVGHCCELAAAGVDVPALRAAYQDQAPTLRRNAARFTAAWIDNAEAGLSLR